METKCSMGKWYVVVGVALAVGVYLVGVVGVHAGETVKQDVKVPILTVRGRRAHCLNISLTLEQDPESNRPLFISIAEDTPMGSGDSLRASVWQVAMSVALLRGDALSGTRITVHIPGYIDGSSAGCALALGLMAALEGRELPSDFAVTGSVLPDGSIGRVGDIHLKMMAAHREGKKRMLVPACLRFEYDSAKGVFVDLKVLADTLGIAYIPVGSLEQAYAVLLAEEPVTREAGIAFADAALPEYLDDYFKDEFTALLGRYEAVVDDRSGGIGVALPDEKALGNSILQQAIATVEAGLQAAGAGYVDVAVSLLREGLAGVFAQLQVVRSIENAEGDRQVEEIRKLITEKSAIPCEPRALVSRLQDLNLSLAVTPFMGGIATGAALQQFVRDLDALSIAMDRKGVKMAASVEDEDLLREMALLLYRARISAWVAEVYSNYDEQILTLNRFFAGDKVEVAPSFSQTEQLLFSSLLTTKNTLDRLLGSVDAEVNAASIYGMLLWGDPELALPFGEMPYALHRAAQVAEGMQKVFLCAIASQVYVRYIAELNRWILLLGELDPYWTEDGGVQIKRHGILHELLTTSRKRALRSIATCREQELPWIAPYLEFRRADYQRDNPQADNTRVLAGYWTAALQADATVMLFKRGAYGQNPVRDVRRTFVEVVAALPGCQPEVRMLRAGDKIITINGIEVRSVDEWTAVAASIPDNESYTIEFMPNNSMRKRSIQVQGGEMPGVQVQNFSMF
ncbi:MAG: hypothetical protein EOM20_18690 [Spartobacteria bacterium]|nr:hypothetical protein [Spartobacteria bacterium]